MTAGDEPVAKTSGRRAMSALSLQGCSSQSFGFRLCRAAYELRMPGLHVRVFVSMDAQTCIHVGDQVSKQQLTVLFLLRPIASCPYTYSI